MTKFQPGDLPLMEITLGDMLDQIAGKFPDNDFLVYADRNLRFSYAEFVERVDTLAKGFLKIGVKNGDHVGLWATNVPDWLVYFFACARIGAVLVTVNTNYRLHELEYLIRQADLTTLCFVDGFKDNNYVQMIYTLAPELLHCEHGHLFCAKFPKLRNVVFMGTQKYKGMFSTPELLLLGAHADDDILAEAAEAVRPHDVVNIQYTSGTTGFPKGVMLSHHNILNNGFFIGERQRFTENDRVCLPVPLFHCFGIVLGVMAAFSHGAALLIIEGFGYFDPLLVLASVEKERATALYGVPSMFIAELNHPMFSMFNLSTLRTGIMAGSPCPIDVMRQVIAKMNMAEVTIVYGLTETSPGMTQTTADDSLERKVGTVGRALPYIEVGVFDPETNERCPLGVQGELRCRGYNVMKGYYNMPEETAQVLDKDGWLASGDLGVVDEHGYYRVTVRIKDMIIRGGENIYPKEVEEFLRQMPQIHDVQVAGVPSRKMGEEVGAFVILKEGAQMKQEDVVEFCRGQISQFKIPRHVFFLEEFPMTASGKIQKFKLTEIGAAALKQREEEAGAS